MLLEFIGFIAAGSFFTALLTTGVLWWLWEGLSTEKERLSTGTPAPVDNRPRMECRVCGAHSFSAVPPDEKGI